MRNALAGILAAVLLAGCQLIAEEPPRSDAPKPTVTSSSVFCQDPTLADDDFCLPVERVESLLRSEREEVLHASVSYGGVSLPNVLYVKVLPDGEPEPVIFKIKWKVAPEGGDGFNNSPRKELAAYEVQKLFLESDAYIVPPSVMRCIPVERHTELIRDEPPNFEGTSCVFGLVAYWVQNVTPEGARDMDRFETDPGYRDTLAALNLLTYLIDHRDSRDANFLVSKDPDRPRTLAIDNGLAFGGFQNPFQKFVGDWGDLHVPTLHRGHVDALRVVTREDLDSLLVVSQFELGEGGLLVEATPGAAQDPEEGVTFDGRVVQLGLTREEVDAIYERLLELLEDVDAGRVELH